MASRLRRLQARLLKHFPIAAARQVVPVRTIFVRSQNGHTMDLTTGEKDENVKEVSPTDNVLVKNGFTHTDEKSDDAKNIKDTGSMVMQNSECFNSKLYSRTILWRVTVEIVALPLVLLSISFVILLFRCIYNISVSADTHINNDLMTSVCPEIRKVFVVFVGEYHITDFMLKQEDTRWSARWLHMWHSLTDYINVTLINMEHTSFQNYYYDLVQNVTMHREFLISANNSLFNSIFYNSVFYRDILQRILQTCRPENTLDLYFHSNIRTDLNYYFVQSLVNSASNGYSSSWSLCLDQINNTLPEIRLYLRSSTSINNISRSINTIYSNCMSSVAEQENPSEKNSGDIMVIFANFLFLAISIVACTLNGVNYGKHLDSTLTKVRGFSKKSEASLEKLKSDTIQSENLVNQMLPKFIAQSLMHGQRVDAETYENVTVYFSDICEFDTCAVHASPIDVVDLLNNIYR